MVPVFLLIYYSRRKLLCVFIFILRLSYPDLDKLSMVTSFILSSTRSTQQDFFVLFDHRVPYYTHELSVIKKVSI